MAHKKTHRLPEKPITVLSKNVLIVLVAVSVIIVSLMYSWYGNRLVPEKRQQQTPQGQAYLPKGYTPDALRTMVNKSDEYVIIDVRDKREYDRGHLPGAVHADYYDAEALKIAAGDKTPITYCTYSAWRGPYAAYSLYKQGYTDVGILNGGVSGWNEKIGLLDTEDDDAPFVYPHPEPDVIYPPRALEKTDTYAGEAKFTITAKRFSFTPDRLVVKKGQKVSLTISADDEIAHGFALPEYGITEELLPGQKKTIEFIADRAGNFPFVCSVYCGADGTTGHSHYSMTGELTVQ